MKTLPNNFRTHLFSLRPPERLRPGLLVGGALVLVLLFALVISTEVLAARYSQRFWPGVTVADISLAGMTYGEAQTQLQHRVDDIRTNGLTYVSPEKTIVLYPTRISQADPDASVELVTWDIDQALKTAWSIGHTDNAINRVRDFLFSFTRRELPMSYVWRQDDYRHALEENFTNLLVAKKEAQLIFNGSSPAISSEASGISYDFETALKLTEQRLAKLQRQPITLEKHIDQPVLTKASLEPLLPKVSEALDFQTFSITFENESYEITPALLKNWLQFAPDKKNKPRLTVNENQMKEWLDQLSKDIEQPTQEAKFKLENDKVVEFQASQDGRRILRDRLFEDLTNNLSKHQSLTLAVEKTHPEKAIADINDLGIKEIIGTGTSDYSGSPKNRRHNIKVGADTLNGLLIKPGEEFSLLKALGEINGETGYLQELVIKGDKTTPEYGGGLCQIGTTTFRATLASGLPVTQRRNHSYRVRYYEPAGTDATIYDPWPDYRFLNDTGHYILIQTKMDDENSKLYFDFWGTRDGRSVEQTKPEIYNLVPPGPTKYIETLDLPVGQKKCTESAHTGADAKFDYNVTYANGEKKDTTFKSHYVPWQEVCLIGVDHLSTTTSETAGGGDVIVNSLN